MSWTGRPRPSPDSTGTCPAKGVLRALAGSSQRSYRGDDGGNQSLRISRYAATRASRFAMALLVRNVTATTYPSIQINNAWTSGAYSASAPCSGSRRAHGSTDPKRRPANRLFAPSCYATEVFCPAEGGRSVGAYAIRAAEFAECARRQT